MSKLRSSALKALIFLIVFISLLSIPNLAFAESPKGVIQGKVSNKTVGGASTANLEIILHVYQGDKEAGSVRGRTDEAGNFKFANLSTESDKVYQVAISEYQGARDAYSSEPISFQSGETVKNIDLAVYDSTESSKDIKVNLQHLIVDVEKGFLVVKEVLLFQNDGDKTFIGKQNKQSGQREALRFTLPREAVDLEYGEGLMECCVVKTNRGFIDTMAISPGTKQVAFNYRIRPSSTSYTLRRPIDYQTLSAALFIPENGIKVKSRQLVSQGVTGEEEKKYQIFAGQKLKSGEELTVELSNLPLGGGIFKLIILGLGLTGLIAGAGYVYRFLRKTSEVSLEAIPLENVQNRQEASLRIAKEELLQTIAELDDKLERGEISLKDYQLERSERKKRLIKITHLLKKLEGA